MRARLVCWPSSTLLLLHSVHTFSAKEAKCLSSSFMIPRERLNALFAETITRQDKVRE